MANNFVDHKDRWLLIANGDFEYPILFIKSWLPFNAWYCNNYPHHKNKDRPILEEMKSDNNLFKTRIIALLQNSDQDSTIFQSNLVKLHNYLESYKVPNAIENISFKSLNYRVNPKTSFVKAHRNHNYKVEIITPTPPNNYRIRIDILNAGGSNIFLYNHTKYDKTHLTSDVNFMALSQQKKDVILEGFEAINPKLKESLIVDRKNESLNTISQVLFKNDTLLLSNAIIEILYNIRCILFHGEIQPSKDNLKIYEPAFYMLKQLIKSLD
ncbi:hypothetical protein [Flavobacterium cyclinae]|uniref:hypothetical protein n=1 Tax=Flavobacterium cyclinae TaxID=2895947 RepID=UPI001E5DB576|nr:hypothetical protein [Flavobacterium cyclinae]UGS21812.1 hypothetical protein LOS86_04085 [Flavobacterium cyclinae]